MFYAADGSWNVTVVDGTTFVGTYAANGSINVIPATGVAYCGARHASGALNVTLVASNQTGGTTAPDGSLRVTTSPYLQGAQRVTVVSGSLAPYSNEAVALFAAMSVQPSDTRKSLINTLIVALKNGGIWDKLDVLYVLAAHDPQAARLNWKNPGSFTASLVNAPTFATDRGYSGDGSTSVLDTGWIPGTHGVNFTLNEAGVWVWNLTDTAITVDDVGTNDSGGATVRTRPTTSRLTGRANDGSTSLFATVANALGLSGVVRQGASLKFIFKNGVAQIGGATASTAMPTTSAYICGSNASSFSSHQIAVAAFGASLKNLELSFYNALLAYMQSVGAA